MYSGSLQELDFYLKEHMMKYKVGDIVTCVRIPQNLGVTAKTAKLGAHYRVLGVWPKVRVTKGTGDYFLSCREDFSGHTVAFNFADVRLKKGE